MSGAPALDGVLVVDKPEGPSSHDVVAVARRALGVSRVGHTGTLDPMATGVLPLVVGRATRLAQYLSSEGKDYEALVRFGLTSDTYDRLGTVRSTSDRRPSRTTVEAALRTLTGTISQRPPAFSAKNLDGTRAYVRARREGAASVQLAPVAVTVERLELVAMDEDTATLSMSVGPGFYVRSLAHDLGTIVGTGAVLDALRRTRSGPFSIDQALSLGEVTTRPRAALADTLVPLDRLLPGLTAVVLDAPDVERVRHGLEVGPFGEALSPAGTVGLVRLMSRDQRLIALGVPGRLPGFLHGSVVLG